MWGRDGGSQAGGCLREHRLHLVPHPRRRSQLLGAHPCLSLAWLEWKRPRHFAVCEEKSHLKGRDNLLLRGCSVPCRMLSSVSGPKTDFWNPSSSALCTPHPSPLAWIVSCEGALLFFSRLCCFGRAQSRSPRGLCWVSSSCPSVAAPHGGFSRRKAWAPGRGLPGVGSWAWAPVAGNGLSCFLTRATFPNQGWNLCSLPWQVDS